MNEQKKTKQNKDKGAKYFNIGNTQQYLHWLSSRVELTSLVFTFFQSTLKNQVASIVLPVLPRLHTLPVSKNYVVESIEGGQYQLPVLQLP